MDENLGAFEEKELKKGGKRLMKNTPPERGAGKGKKGWLALGIVLGVLVCAYFALGAYAAGMGILYPNTSLAGVDYSGLTRQQAEEKIAERIARAETSTVRFVLADGETEIARVDLGTVAPAVDAAMLARDLYALRGCDGNVLTAGAEFLRALFVPMDCLLYLGEAQEACLLTIAQEVQTALVCDPVEFSAEVTADGTVRVTKAMYGRSAPETFIDDAVALLHRAYLSGAAQDTIRLNTTEAEGGVYEVVPARHVDLAEEREKLLGEVMNAGYNKETGEITADRAGVDFSLSALTSAYEAAASGETFTLDADVVLPEVTAEQLAECLFRDELSSYTTKVGGASGRHKNVQLTAERIDGYILNAGETMQYGPLVTPFTKENGYYPAPGYYQGKTVDMYGGGACQASSTLYAAALYANLEIVQRVNHGFASDYIGLGLDATVAEGGPEFEFRNNTLYPIKVQAEFYTKNGKDYLKITLLGTKTDDSYVKIRTDVLETIPFEEEIIESDELAPGERRVEQTAYTGYKVKTYRNVYAGDGTLISSEFEASSNYKARNRIVLVGKAAETETPAPDSGEVTPAPDAGEEPTDPAPQEPTTQPDWLTPGD